MTGPKILAVITCVIVMALAALVALSDEWTSCHIANWQQGYFSAPGLPPGLAVSGGAASKTIDFRRLKNVTEVCIINIQYYSEPGFSQSMIDRGFRWGRPMGCWRDTEGKIIVVGRSKDMPLMWEQIDMGDPPRWYTPADKQCAEIENAVLTCRDEACAFPD